MHELDQPKFLGKTGHYTGAEMCEHEVKQNSESLSSASWEATDPQSPPGSSVTESGPQTLNSDLI